MVVRLVIILIVFSISNKATAEIFKCTTSEGKITFQQEPCESGVERKIESKKKAQVSGIHSSWFDKPLYSVETARCTETGCICGERNKVYSQSIKYRVLNALRRLHSAWESHERSIKSHRSMTSSRNYARNYSRSNKSLLSSSCEVSISQETLKLYYKEVADDIINVYQSASKELEKLEKTCRSASGELSCGKKTKRNHRSAERKKKRVASDYFSLMQEIKRLERPRI